jgi:hypothetical protein
MALIPKFTVIEASGGVGATLTDKTGTYSSSNLGGYGSSNIFVAADCTAASLVITPLNSDLTLGTSLPAINLFSLGYPSVNSTLGLTSVQFGQALVTDVIPDVVYQFVITSSFVNGEITGTFTFTFYQGFTANLICCLQTKRAKQGCCDCNGKTLTKAQQDIQLLDMIITNIADNAVDPITVLPGCQNVASMVKCLDEGTTLCSDCGCGCSDC